MQMSVKNFIIDILFPKFCLNCNREGSYLCQDCQAILEISTIHQNFSSKNIKDLYFPLPYQNLLIKKLIQKFKYQPFIKELAESLSFLIIEHFCLLDNKPDFSGFFLIPIPLTKKREKWRGFNQTEEIGKKLSCFLNIPLIVNCLLKVKETLPQIELTNETRKENIKNAFVLKNKGLVRDKKILLVDDIYTTGSTMEECAKLLREAGAKEIIGIVVARG